MSSQKSGSEAIFSVRILIAKSSGGVVLTPPELFAGQHEWKNNISILINNAGLAAGLDLIQDGSIDDWDQMIDTNVKGLLYVKKAIVPFMIVDQNGHIFNMGSSAGKDFASGVIAPYA